MILPRTDFTWVRVSRASCCHLTVSSYNVWIHHVVLLICPQAFELMTKGYVYAFCFSFWNSLTHPEQRWRFEPVTYRSAAFRFHQAGDGGAHWQSFDGGAGPLLLQGRGAGNRVLWVPIHRRSQCCFRHKTELKCKTLISTVRMQIIVQLLHKQIYCSQFNSVSI